MSPFPSIDQAYAHVHREALQQAVMSTSDLDNTSGVVLITKGLKLSSANTNSIAVSSHGKSTTAFKSQTVPDGMKCPHCGNQCHTSENCLKKNGYPDWWYELQAKKKKDSAGADANKGKVAIMSAKPHISLIPQVESSQDAGSVSDIGNCGFNLVTSFYDVDRGAWLLDSGALNHMTFVATDFTTTSPPRRTSVANANGVVSPITRVGSVYLSPSLQLLNTLLVPLLSHKLLFVSPVTIELNCVVLVYPTFCILQDILTKEIIGHSTKRGVVYTTWKMLAQVMFTKYKVM